MTHKLLSALIPALALLLAAPRPEGKDGPEIWVYRANP